MKNIIIALSLLLSSITFASESQRVTLTLSMQTTLRVLVENSQGQVYLKKIDYLEKGTKISVETHDIQQAQETPKKKGKIGQFFSNIASKIFTKKNGEKRFVKMRKFFVDVSNGTAKKLGFKKDESSTDSSPSKSIQVLSGLRFKVGRGKIKLSRGGWVRGIEIVELPEFSHLSVAEMDELNSKILYISAHHIPNQEVEVEVEVTEEEQELKEEPIEDIAEEPFEDISEINDSQELNVAPAETEVNNEAQNESETTTDQEVVTEEEVKEETKPEEEVKEETKPEDEVKEETKPEDEVVEETKPEDEVQAETPTEDEVKEEPVVNENNNEEENNNRVNLSATYDNQDQSEEDTDPVLNHITQRQEEEPNPLDDIMDLLNPTPITSDNVLVDVTDYDNQLPSRSSDFTPDPYIAPSDNTRVDQQFFDLHKCYAGFVHAGVPETPLKRSINFFNENRDKFEDQDLISFSDFSKNSRKKRFYALNLTTCEILTMEYTSHGSGRRFEKGTKMYPGDPNHDGMLDSCAYRGDRTNHTRAGFMKIKGYHWSRKNWPVLNSSNNVKGLKLHGLEDRNEEVLSRGVVLHESYYMKNASVRQSRSWGCPMFAEARLKAFYKKLKKGSLYYSYAPQCE